MTNAFKDTEVTYQSFGRLDDLEVCELGWRAAGALDMENCGPGWMRETPIHARVVDATGPTGRRRYLRKVLGLGLILQPPPGSGRGDAAEPDVAPAGAGGAPGSAAHQKETP